MVHHKEPDPVVLTSGKKRHECTQCDEVFFSDNPEAIFKHQEEKIKLGEGHLECLICNEKLHSSEAFYYHLRMNHPADQDLNCPACGQHHNKVYKLMDHLVDCDKAAYAIARIETARDKSLKFVRELAYRDEARHKKGVQLGPAPINSDFGEYLGHRDPRVDLPDEEQKLASEMHDLGLESSSSVEKFHKGDSKCPDLLTSDDNWAQKENNNPRVQKSAPVTADMLASKRLFPNAPPAVQPTAQQLKHLAASHDPQTPALNLDIRDPDNPKFSVGMYYEHVMDKYRCAYAPHCIKTFKKAGQLIGHLKTNDHQPAKYRCPFCSKMYRTLSALTQHCETPNTFCEIDYSYSYRVFLGQLTGGVIDVDGKHADHTPKYTVTNEAKVIFGQGQSILPDKNDKKAGKAQQPKHREAKAVEGPPACPTPEVLQARQKFQEAMQPQKRIAVYDDFVESYEKEKREAQQRRLAENASW
ncbi:hypothetical protein MGG_07013 [Pyricularia oryzae 70-15]|uniref:C2H2-type domain-containing protein n=1 Tax=Pyricularia oryzae (strain 70-15 / ATCC MYA-4617 / FGSC 8958) TaxID=242507 RepID=G4MPA6_PYRO7|nr:uncharacterized protein MGG_07013 [Pyricularia oryzae 70-15]EHA57159.1 hypothetical protein MGG_07013 [Pyricularia oryzae 70-15]KAI7921489.1 hypothetical protein M9X92_005380 [Pyricularia oryzae]KAI7927433.1 hypothetical protein M0657_003255 [Pyricularia oryzae]